ncbi:protein FAR-RED IMPAIRED RESPONSE 1-like [Vigna umbellata]|uniref:protein FAR-RED IMPAIRED RESPONSE 1-like n=1 Tax=Vigna umbellata TaxID=87088 RepID=UPI001F5FAC3F|nr:protein FAR-RED IMPAIRED RESPONSE 1-like [Vigna umbellata]
MKKLPEKFQGYKQYVAIKTDLNALVYDCGCPTDFGNDWEELLIRHGLQENEWLCTLYEERHIWVPCYLRNHFWVGMSTTQRSEGMNAFFHGFIYSRTILHQFVVQYDNALRVKAQKEIQVDFSSLNTRVACGSQSPIERQLQLEYTHAKFEEVQTEFRSRMNCFIKETIKDNFNTYTMKEEHMWKGKCADKLYKVQFDPVTKNSTCLAYYLSLEASFVPIAFWYSVRKMFIVCPQNTFYDGRKNIRKRHTLIRAAYSNSNHEPTMQRYQILFKRFYEIAEVACESEVASNDMEKELHLLGKRFGCSSSITNNIISEGGELRYDNPVTGTIHDTTSASVDVLVLDRETKKRRPSSSRDGRRRQRNPTPSPPSSPPPPNNELFSSDEQYEKFANHFFNCEILESKYLEDAYFEGRNFQFYDILSEAGLTKFVSLNRDF